MQARCEQAASLPGDGPGSHRSPRARWAQHIHQMDQPDKEGTAERGFLEMSQLFRTHGGTALLLSWELGQLCHRQLAFLAGQKEGAPSSRWSAGRPGCLGSGSRAKNSHAGFSDRFLPGSFPESPLSSHRLLQAPLAD